MDFLSKLALGWQMALTGPHLLAMLCGSLLGLLNGLLGRGLSVPALMALLLPLVPELEAGSALILLMAVCGSAQFARAGTAGVGSAAAAAGAAVLASLAIGVLAPWLTAMGFHFAAAESFSLMLLCLALACALTAGSLLNSMAMAVLGLLLTQIGHDPIFGSPRFLVEFPQLRRGIDVAPLAIGLMAGADLLFRMERPVDAAVTPALGPASRTSRSVLVPLLRGAGVGLLLGLLPGGGAQWASAAASQLERRLSGGAFAAAVPGIAPDALPAAAAAEQAATRVAFVPMLALGVPINASVALLAVALSLKGVQAGPLLMTGRPDLFWGLLASIALSAVVLLVASMATARWWPVLTALSAHGLAMPLLLAACLGVVHLSAADPAFDLAVMTLATFAGYLLRKLNCQTAPLLLAFILGPAMEDSLRRALQRADGDWAALVDRPLSAILLVLAALTVAAALLPWTRRHREAMFGAGA